MATYKRENASRSEDSSISLFWVIQDHQRRNQKKVARVTAFSFSSSLTHPSQCSWSPHLSSCAVPLKDLPSVCLLSPPPVRSSPVLQAMAPQRDVLIVLRENEDQVDDMRMKTANPGATSLVQQLPPAAPGCSRLYLCRHGETGACNMLAADSWYCCSQSDSFLATQSSTACSCSKAEALMLRSTTQA